MNNLSKILNSNKLTASQKVISLKRLIQDNEDSINESQIIDEVTYTVNSTKDPFCFVHIDEEGDINVYDLGVSNSDGLMIAEGLQKFYTKRIGGEYNPN